MKMARNERTPAVKPRNSTMRRWAGLFAMLAAGAYGLSAAIASQDRQAVFTLGGKAYSIVLPEKVTIKNSAAPDEILIDDLSKSQRLQRSLVISLAPNEAGSAIDRVERLRGGNSLAYQIADDIGGGSGGSIAELKGRITVGDVQLFIECTDQHEWSRDPKWCVPLLDSLKPAPPPQ
jgi:hypothetical protein